MAYNILSYHGKNSSDVITLNFPLQKRQLYTLNHQHFIFSKNAMFYVGGGEERLALAVTFSLKDGDKSLQPSSHLVEWYLFWQSGFSYLRPFTKAINESASLFSEGYFMGREECFGNNRIVGKLPSCSSFWAKAFCSPSALNFPIFTPEASNLSANSTKEASIA